LITTDLLLRIYMKAKQKPKPLYPPMRKHYNLNLFG